MDKCKCGNDAVKDGLCWECISAWVEEFIARCNE